MWPFSLKKNNFQRDSVSIYMKMSWREEKYFGLCGVSFSSIYIREEYYNDCRLTHCIVNGVEVLAVSSFVAPLGSSLACISRDEYDGQLVV